MDSEQEYMLIQDDDDHWYVIAVKDTAEFYKQLASGDPDFDELDIEEVGGATSLVHFRQYTIR